MVQIKDNSQLNSGMDGAIVIHIHGGGFVSMTSAVHRVYLNQWVNKLNVVHFSIDYKLAPENQYPDGLNDCWQSYLWIMNYCESVLGIKNQKVIVVGDSAGGNLALALTLRCIRAGIKAPDGCLLIYPCLSVDAKSSSPSYLGSIGDHMLPTGLLRLVAFAYVPDGFKNMEDPFISPMVASDELLAKMPPVRIIAGSKDPLYDDNWRLIQKMKKLKKDVSIIVHEHMPHAYLCNPDLKNFDHYMEEACDAIRELVSKVPTSKKHEEIQEEGGPQEVFFEQKIELSCE
jgi:hormone-sensitive lipase